MTAHPAQHRSSYDVPETWSLSRLSALMPAGAVECTPTVELSIVEYFDTAERDLLTFGAVLVRRSGEVDPGWTLAFPTPDGTSRHHRPPGDDATPPAELGDLVQGMTRGADLTHLATVEVDNTRHRWVDRAGVTIVDVVDSTVRTAAAGSGSAQLSSRREIGFTVGPAGRPKRVKRLVGALAGAGSVRTETDDAFPTELLPGSRTTGRTRRARQKTGAAEQVVAYLAAQDAALITEDLALRTGQDDVHAIRVATRRIRSTLRVFGALLEPGPTTEFDRELSWYATLLGEVRDRQVQRARFAEALADLPDEQVLGPVAATVEQYLLSGELRAKTVLREAMASSRYHRLLRLSAEFSRRPPTAPRSRTEQGPDVVTDAARRARRKALRRLDQALVSADDDLLHRARRAAKRARYAAELSTGKGHRTTKTARQFKQLQEILGDFQDSTVAAALLRQLAAGTHADPTQNGFTYGILHEQEARRAAQARIAARRWRNRL